MTENWYARRVPYSPDRSGYVPSSAPSWAQRMLTMIMCDVLTMDILDHKVQWLSSCSEHWTKSGKLSNPC